MQNKNHLLSCPQSKLGYTGTIFFLVLMDTFVSLATDMYLPAMPAMGQQLGTSDAMIKMTVTVYFLFYALGMILWGPLSDKYGRRLPLICGFSLFCVATVFCMISPNIYILLICRVFQGIGGACASALSMAMVKDCFAGKIRERILAIVQTISGIGPIIAPIIGSWLLLFTNWRGIFFAVLLCGILGLVGSVLYEESLPKEERVQGSAFQSFGQIKVVLHNKLFVWIVLMYSILFVPYYVHLNLSSYIYVQQFGCTEQVYSYYYSASALLSMIGPYLYIRFWEQSEKERFTYIGFGCSLLVGILTSTIGTTSPFWFCVMIFLLILISNVFRPFSVNLILEQQKRDIGTASSLMKMGFNLFGCLGMLIAAIPFKDMVVATGIIIIICSVLPILIWYYLMRSKDMIRGM